MKSNNMEANDIKAKVIKTDFIQIADIAGQSWIDPLKRFRFLYQNKEIVINTHESINKFRVFILKLLFGKLISIEDSKKRKFDSPPVAPTKRIKNDKSNK